MSKKSSYQIMTSILNTYKPTKKEKLTINPFFFIRWLSNSPKAIHIANVFNRFYKEIPINVQYDIAKQLLKNKIKYIQFPKKLEENNNIIFNISKYYKINLEKASEYYEIMPETERNRFRDLYKGA